MRILVLVIGMFLGIVVPANAQTYSTRIDPKCDPTAIVAGKVVHVIAGLPLDKCRFDRTYILRKVQCDTDYVRVEPHTPTRKERRKWPLAKGTHRWHFVCLHPPSLEP